MAPLLPCVEQRHETFVEENRWFWRGFIIIVESVEAA